VLPTVLLPLSWFIAARALSVETALFVLGGFSVAVAGWLGWHGLLPRPAPLVVDDDGVAFPYFRHHRRLALDEIVVARATGGALLLVAAVPPDAVARGDVGVWLLPRRVFFGADDAATVVAAIRARLDHHPDQQRLLRRLDDNAERQRQFAATRPIVTWATVGLCAVVYVAEELVGAVADVDVLLRLGANAGVLVRQGEVWRVVTACFLHGGALHLVMNASSLLSTGALIERWLGRPAMILVLFGSGAGGHLASALAARAPASVGISGAVFGLLGVLLVSSWRYRAQGTGGLRVPASSWVFLLLANAWLATLPFLDVVAHAAGFAFGVVVGAVVSPRPGRPPVVGPRALRRGAALVVVLTIVAIGWAVAAALRG
jgi:rhomboid protease GluP